MSDFDKFVDKKVTFVRNEAGKTEAEECEGTVIAVNGGIVMFKPKGKTTPTLVPEGEIENMSLAEDKAKTLARKVLKPVELGQARNHLLERHGFTLKQVNDLTEQQAYDTHLQIDHVAADLGHEHGEKPKPEASSNKS